MDYATYLDNFYRFDKIPADRKNNQYALYLEELCTYLVSFYERTNPLDNLKLLLERVVKSSKDKHKAMEQIEIKKEGDSPKPSKELYCGVCKQVFSKLTVYQAHMASKRHKTAVSKQHTGSDHSNTKENIRLLEAKISMLSDQLAGVIQASKGNVEKRLSMTWEELEASRETEGQEYQEIVPEDKEEKENDSDAEEKIWNPKGLPLDVTGKPIPYWLWKLHGLGVEYQCEICGNYSYWGHYAFEKHFQEWRHQHAMKILGLPNTKAFHHITTINDALALHMKLKQDINKGSWRPETEEEFEDKEGNVIPRKIYEDMMRQGII